MKIIKLALFSILTLFISCKTESNAIFENATIVISKEDFSNIQNVKTEELENISDSLLFSTMLLIKNDHLFISESKSDRLLHAIKIPEDKYMGKFLNSGSGPGEALIAWSLYENENLLGVYDSKQKKLIEFNTDSLLSKNRFKDEYIMHNTSAVGGRYYHFGNKIYFMDCNQDENFALQSMNVDGTDLKGLGELPLVDKNVFDIKKDINLNNIYNSILDYKNGTFVIAYQFIPVLKIFNSKTNQWITIAGPDDFIPSLKTLYKRFCYSYVTFTDKYIYALYNGKTDVPDGPQKFNTNTVYVFDHQGKFQKKMVLDRGIHSIAIYKDKFLYGVGFNEIGEFKLIKAKI